MSETVGEIVKRLARADNYLKERLTVSDQFVEFVRDNLPRDYKWFSEKEEAYQKVLEMLPTT